MITEIAKHRMRVLAHWDKHGLKSAMDAFLVKRRTLFYWKKALKTGQGRYESLNPGNRAPKAKRKRLWPQEVIEEIKRLRWAYPNLGPDKLQPLLSSHCASQGLICPSASTVKRLIKDQGGLRIYPQKITHFGKTRPLKRRKVLRKPKDLKVMYPGHVVALDTVERFVHGIRRYVITFEDIYTRYGFAWGTSSHASLAAKEFFELCIKVFPFPFTFVLTDNGSEFAKHFASKLNELHLTHYHTYPRTPKMNAHCERFNRTIQEEYVDYHVNELLEPAHFNKGLMDYLIFYNTRRVHYAFKNKLSPVQFMLQWQEQQLNLGQECKWRWPYTRV
jgi:transposase InsO family protein